MKRFALTVNFDEVRRDIAEALILVSDNTVKKTARKQTVVFKDAFVKKELARRNVAMIASTFVGVAGVGVMIGLTILGGRKAS